MFSNTAESFGKQWQVGDVVGVFLDLIDHTISKSKTLHALMLLLCIHAMLACEFYVNFDKNGGQITQLFYRFFLKWRTADGCLRWRNNFC